ncbi:Nitrogen assimilation transcription factor nit-4-like protein [Cladobotryum mycophilum]|uniref:Nitrogen assimilation transcription factor nit-4-like protein n=1 Tax=Cladobotryum mycophilum TaxID=491253 RepID=A0ABR0SW12_9HYPO
MKQSKGNWRPLQPTSLTQDDLTSERLKRPSRIVKRTLTIAACESCRRRKAKCDGTRPRCAACVRRDQECRYLTKPSESHTLAVKRELNDLKGKHQSAKDSHARLEHVFHLIKTLPDADAAAIVKRIRAGADLDSIVRNISDGDLLLQLRLIPETKYRYEFPWKKQIPASLQRQDNPYLQHLIYDSSSAYIPRATIGSSKSEIPSSHYFTPLAAAKIVDPRLDSVKPSQWTTVCDDDIMMKDMLHNFFLYEYSWITNFHKDDFLEDMASGRTEFCSSLLVNVLLAFASHCHLTLPYRAEFWNPQGLGYKFFAEAKRLWELEAYSTKSLPTVQAATLFHLQYVLFGLDELAYTYITQAIDMSQQLHLFDKSLEGESFRFKRSRAITVCFVAYHFKQAPPFSFQPRVVLPDPDEDGSWYGEIWLKYPLDSSVYPMQHPQCFKARMDFSLILNRMAATLYGSVQSKPAASLSEHISGFALEMNHWYQTLPEPMLPINIVFPAQSRLHTHYLQMVMELQDIMVANQIPIIAISPANDAASTSAVAMDCFETLLRISYLRHSFENSNVLGTEFLHTLAFSSLNKLKNTSLLLSRSQIDDIRSSLILAAKGLYEQGRNWYCARLIFHLLLEYMCQDDRDLLLRFANIDITRHKLGEGSLKMEYVKSQYPINIASPADDPEGRRLANLLKEKLILEHK